MKNKILSLLLVAALAAATLVGCGQANTESATTSTTVTKESESTSTSTEAAEEVKVAYEDLPTLNILATHGYTYESDENQVWRAVAEAVGAKIHIIGADTDKYNAMLASGEGYDIIWSSKGKLKDIATGGSLLALDDLVKDYSNISAFTDFIPYSKEMYSDDSGALYWLPAELKHNGKSVTSKDVTEGMIRWDLYEKMGYPETNSVDEFIEMLVDMKEAYPTNAAGEKVYGMTIPSDKLLETFTSPFVGWAGKVEYQKTATYAWEDLAYENVYGENGVFWYGVDFFHKAYLAGLLDPDSFTLTEADMKAKASAGRLLFINRSFQVDAATMAAGTGFSAIPINWAAANAANNNVSSTVSFNYGLGINKNSDKIDLCLKYLDFVSGEEGANLVLNGFEGVHYTVDANGVRSLTAEGLALYKDQAAWGEAGLGTTEGGHFLGLAKNAIASDGKAMLLGLDRSLFVESLTDTQKAFCEHYGVDYPAQAFVKIAAENNFPNPEMIDGMARNFLPVPGDEIAQLELAVRNEAMNLVADLVMADEDEYEAKVKAAKETLAKVGVTKIDEWYNANWQSAFDKAASLSK